MDRENVRDILKELSPINHVTAQSAPMLFIFGDKDNITTIGTQGTPMLEKLKAAGVPCEIIVKPGRGHSWPGIKGHRIDHRLVRYASPWRHAHPASGGRSLRLRLTGGNGETIRNISINKTLVEAASTHPVFASGPAVSVRPARCLRLAWQFFTEW